LARRPHRVASYLAAKAFNRGTTLVERDELARGQRWLLASLALAPYTAMTWLNLGNALKEVGDVDAALGCYRRAMELEPSHPRGAVNVAIALMTLSRWESGWALYEQRFALPEFQLRNALKGGDETKVWRGEPLRGKTLLVFNEQGVGDTLMCFRYSAQLAGAGAKVIWRAPASLMRLFRASSFMGERIISDTERLPRHDYLVPAMSLPLYCDPTCATRYDPYLDVYRDDAPAPATRDRLNVGVVWAGNPNHKGDRRRSISIDTLAPLFELPGIDWVSLQAGPRANDVAAFPRVRRVDTSDYYDTACAMKSLDLVISADSSPAHLAGALSVPCWTLLPFAADFRWMQHRETTPWYESMTLFRQRAAGDWLGVINRVRARLVSLAKQRSAV
jgi:hypothetical protein